MELHLWVFGFSDCLEGAHEGGPVDFKSLSISGFCPEQQGQCFISFTDNPPDPCLLKIIVCKYYN